MLIGSISYMDSQNEQTIEFPSTLKGIITDFFTQFGHLVNPFISYLYCIYKNPF